MKNLLLAFWTSLCAAGFAGASPIDVDQLKIACTAAMSAPSAQIATGLAGFADGEWIRFGRGKVTEASDEQLITESPTTSLLSWDKVYQYWTATKSESALSYPYALRHIGNVRQRDMAIALEEINAVRRNFAGDPVHEQKITAALRRSAVNSTAWSAVFISTMFKVNAFTRDEFEGSASHSMYMRSALDRNERADHRYRQLPCDPSWIKPRVGDLVCYSRQKDVNSFADVIARYSAWSESRDAAADAAYRFDSHCDIVSTVGDRQMTFDSIGGNIGNSVTKTRRKAASGYVDSAKNEAGASSSWLMVLVLKP